MTHDKIAKNLLLDKTCDDCHRHGDCGVLRTKNNTCEEWDMRIYLYDPSGLTKSNDPRRNS